MSKKFVAAIVFVLVLAASSVSFAQDNKEKVYDFSGDDIDGDVIRPDGDNLNVANIASHTSLIKIRLDFIKEILKAAENL